jgi:hypothetical protein
MNSFEGREAGPSSPLRASLLTPDECERSIAAAIAEADLAPAQDQIVAG